MARRSRWRKRCRRRSQMRRRQRRNSARAFSESDGLEPLSSIASNYHAAVSKWENDQLPNAGMCLPSLTPAISCTSSTYQGTYADNGDSGDMRCACAVVVAKAPCLKFDIQVTRPSGHGTCREGQRACPMMAHRGVEERARAQGAQRPSQRGRGFTINRPTRPTNPHGPPHQRRLLCGT